MFGWTVRCKSGCTRTSAARRHAISFSPQPAADSVWARSTAKRCFSSRSALTPRAATPRAAVTVDFPHCRVQLSKTRGLAVSSTLCCIGSGRNPSLFKIDSEIPSAAGADESRTIGDTGRTNLSQGAAFAPRGQVRLSPVFKLTTTRYKRLGC